MTKHQSPVLYLFAALFLISGAAGLMYEIVWERLLELYFGVTMVSVTLIVSAYMAGLGIGSLIGGRIAHHVKNTLLLYGLVEIGIALFGAISPAIIIWIGESTAGSPYLLVFLLSFVVLLIPTTLMGMTLPLLIQSFVSWVEISGRIIGLLYGINTLGAAFGSLLAGYISIGLFGFKGTIYVAVLLNALVGLCAFLFLRWKGVESKPELAQKASETPAGWGYKTILISSFLVGFIGLGFEMLWIRVLLIVNKNTAYAFPSILFVFLVGLAIGGYYWARRADTSANPLALFCTIELVGAAIAGVTFLLFALSLRYGAPWIADFAETQKPVLPFVESNGQFFLSRRALLGNVLRYFLPIVILVLPAALIQGGGLPVLDRLSINNPQVSGRRVGDIHVANIFGSVMGSLAISFLFLPNLGTEQTLKFLIVATFLFPTMYFFGKSEKTVVRRDVPVFGVTALIVLLGVGVLPQKSGFYNSLYSHGMENREVVVSESGDSVLALTYEPGSNKQAGLFWIGGEINSFFPATGMYEERAMVCAGAARPKRILIIGYGGGYSTLFYKSIPEVEEIVVVELLTDIAPFLAENLESVQVTLDDPRVTYLVDDGRRYLNAFPNEKFDLISIDPLRRHTAGHNNLYSEEALRIYQSHLNPGGVLCAWMDEVRVIPNTVAQVFTAVDQFAIEFMVASNSEISYDTKYMSQIADNYAQLTQQIYGANGPDVLQPSRALSLFVRDQDQILEAEQDSVILRDMEPWLEYYLLRAPTGDFLLPSPDALESFNARVIYE